MHKESINKHPGKVNNKLSVDLLLLQVKIEKTIYNREVLSLWILPTRLCLVSTQGSKLKKGAIALRVNGSSNLDFTSNIASLMYLSHTMDHGAIPAITSTSLSVLVLC